MIQSLKNLKIISKKYIHIAWKVYKIVQLKTVLGEILNQKSLLTSKTTSMFLIRHRI